MIQITIKTTRLKINIFFCNEKKHLIRDCRWLKEFHTYVKKKYNKSKNKHNRDKKYRVYNIENNFILRKFSNLNNFDFKKKMSINSSFYSRKKLIIFHIIFESQILTYFHAWLINFVILKILYLKWRTILLKLKK